jgi:very-short-patch-repair endonuclease
VDGPGEWKAPIAQDSTVGQEQRERPWTDDLATMDAIVAAGTSYDTARRRIRTKTWQELLPGVVCRTTGAPTRRQWMRAALLWLGPSAALSHSTAVELWDLPLHRDRIVVTTLGTKHPASRDPVWVRQSERPFRPAVRRGLVVTPPARSVVDACLDLRRLSEVDDLLGRSLQARVTSLDNLADELDHSPSGGSRLPRVAMAELAAGSHAASEAQLIRLIRRAALPEPELNAAVLTISGAKYIDALWRALGKGVEVDGQAYHLSPEQWRADLQRQNDVQSAGIVLLRIAARRLWTEPDAVIREIRWFLGLARAA